MFANVVIARYRDPQDIDQAVGKIEKIASELKHMSGFERMFIVRTEDTQTVHTVVFQSEEDARSAREKLLPRFKQEIGEHLTGEPRVTPGPVLVDMKP